MGPGVGDEGFLFLGQESPFTLVTENVLGESASCLSLDRIRVDIRGPQNQEVGFRFTQPCEQGHYSLAWTPCLTGWHTVALYVDNVPVRSSPHTVWVSGSVPVKAEIVGGGAKVEFDFYGMLEGALE